MGSETNIEESKFPLQGAEGVKRIYFLGIGGIGMSALARYFNSKGVVVNGYDKTETVLTKQLVKEGIGIHFEDDIKFIDKDADLVVYTPAVPKDHKELNYFLDNKYKVAKRSDVLEIITNSSFNICIAGTHGKTTTSTMVAHILRHSGYGCNAFLGGIAVNYDSNFWSNERNVCVVEADEYDRSFLKLSPDVAIISSMDPDHLDIYGTAENMEQAFIDFSKRIKPGGLLLSKYGLKRTEELAAHEHLTFHLHNENASVYAANVKMINGSYSFDVLMQYWELRDVVLNMGGLHNIENMIAAISVAHYLDIDNGFKERLFAAKTTKDTMKSLVYVFEQLNDVHTQMYLNNQYYGHYPAFPDSVLKTLNPIVERSRQENGTIRTILLKNKYLYISIPGIFAQGNAVNEYAQTISDSICRYNRQQLKGFIIDLRLNSGGQLSSMVGGLNLLLGNNYLGGAVDALKTEARKFELKKNNFYIGDVQTTSITNTCAHDYSKTPVVVLIGPATVSSGSITAITFKQRPNTFFIGEPTADGYSTGNEYFFFGNSFMINLATEFNQDRKHNIYKNSILPDKFIKAGDDFDKLLNDEKIKAALLWLANANPLK